MPSSFETDALAKSDLTMVSSLATDSSTNLELIITFSLETGTPANSDLIMSIFPFIKHFSVFPPTYNVSHAIYLTLQSTLSLKCIYITIISLITIFPPSKYFPIRIFIITSIFSPIFPFRVFLP